MAIRFPLTIKAAQRAETDLWEFGDALLRECGVPRRGGTSNAGGDKIKAAQEALAARGIEMDIETMRRARMVSHKFPPSKRIAGVSRETHFECGTPERMRAILKIWQSEHPVRNRQPNEPILPRNSVRRIQAMFAQQEADEQDRREHTARERARREAQEAEARLAAARQQAAGANSWASRTTRDAQVAQAQRGVERARQRVQETEALPEHNPEAAGPEPASSLVYIAGMMAKITRASVLAEQVLAELERADDYGLHQDTVQGLREQAHITHEAWVTVEQALRGMTTVRGGHLSVVA